MIVNTRAAVLEGPGRLSIQEIEIPAVTDDAATIEVEVCGVCGTDRQLYAGDEDAPYPLVLGHEGVGRILQVGAAAADKYQVAEGDRVVIEPSIPCWNCEQCWSGNYRLCPTKGGYGQRWPLSVPPGLWGAMANVMFIAPGSIVHKVPEGLSATAAVGIQILANSVHWLGQMGGLSAGDRVLVSGCGPQGLVAAIFARVAGAAEVVVTGLASDTSRLEYARSVGARPVQVGDAGQVADVGADYDLILDVSGSPGAISSAVSLLRPQGTLVLAGRVGRGRAVSLNTDLIWKREIRVQGVIAKDSRAVSTAMSIASHDARVASELEELTTHTFTLDQAVDAIEAAGQGLSGFVKAAVVPGT